MAPGATVSSPKAVTWLVAKALDAALAIWFHSDDRVTTRQMDNTVEPPNKGHFGNGHFVLFSEAVPISEACHCLTI